MSIILASSSPRRRELMERMGLDIVIRTAPTDETMRPDGDPYDEVADVSRRKALAALPLCNDDDFIVAADTVVVCDGLVMGKPRDVEDAVRMLRLLSGREHQVMTGVTVRRGDRAETKTVVTGVRGDRGLRRDRRADGQGRRSRGAGACRPLYRWTGRRFLQRYGLARLYACGDAPRVRRADSGLLR